MYFVFDDESEFHQRLNPVAMAKRQIPNGYKNTTKSLIKGIKPLKQNQNISESEDYDDDYLLLFDEDAHPRSTRSSLHNPQGFGKVKFVRADLTNMNFKDYKKIQKDNSTPRQYREFLRTIEKGAKSMRQIHGQSDDQNLVKHKISKNFKKHLLRNDDQNQSKKKEFLENIKKNRQFNQQNIGGNHPNYKKEYQNGMMNSIKMMGAAYNPMNRNVLINKSVANYKDPILRRANTSHELTHKNQFDYARSKEGKQGERRLAKNNSDALQLGVSNDDYKDFLGLKLKKKIMTNYIHNPLERQAFEVGANTNHPNDRLHDKSKFDSKYAKLTLNRKKLFSAVKRGKYSLDQNIVSKQSKLDRGHDENDLFTPRFPKPKKQGFLTR